MTIQSMLGWRPLVVLSVLWMSVMGVHAEALAPTLEQRVAGLEAYLGNGDPTAALKDANLTMKDIISSKIGELGENIVVRRFTRFAVGEGEAKTEEVAA